MFYNQFSKKSSNCEKINKISINRCDSPLKSLFFKFIEADIITSKKLK